MGRIIEMAWEDRTTFDAIHGQFGLDGTRGDCLDERQNGNRLSVSDVAQTDVTGRIGRSMAFWTGSERFRAACHR